MRFLLWIAIAFCAVSIPADGLANDVKKRGNSLTYLQNEFQTHLDIYRTDGDDAQCFNVIRARQHATDAIELGDASLAEKFNAFNASLSGECRLSPFKLPGVTKTAAESGAMPTEGGSCGTFAELIVMADRGHIISICNNGYLFMKKN